MLIIWHDGLGFRKYGVGDNLYIGAPYPFPGVVYIVLIAAVAADSCEIILPIPDDVVETLRIFC